MTAQPAYRVLVPGLKHFECEPLRATLSTQACAQRWSAAIWGSACHRCEIGRTQATNLGLMKRPGRRPVDIKARVCLRCGRTDLRIIVSTGSCVSCWNREREWVKGKNAKGKTPVTYQPLHSAEVAIQHQDGGIERRLISVAHQSEALGRTLRDLPEGARLLTNERRHTAWNRQTGEFEITCPRCGVDGLVLELQRSGGRLEHFHWCCANADPPGGCWSPAKVRQQILLTDVDAAAAMLSCDPELRDETPCEWTPTAFACLCGTGQVEARLLEQGGRWQTRCQACGITSR